MPTVDLDNPISDAAVLVCIQMLDVDFLFMDTCNLQEHERRSEEGKRRSEEGGRRREEGKRRREEGEWGKRCARVLIFKF